MNLLKNEKGLKIISLLAILISVFIIILFFVSNKVFPGINNNQNNKILDKNVSQNYPEIKTVPKDQGYQEIETVLTNRSIESDSPTADVDNEIKRLSESGQIFWHDKNKVSTSTPMHYLQTRLKCSEGPEGKCSIIGPEVYPDSIPAGYKVGKCDGQGGTCLVIEPAFQKNLANSMSTKGSVDFYGFDKDIYMIGSTSGDDNYSIFKNEKEIFTHKMVFITERFEEVNMVLNSPTFTFFEEKEGKDKNNPAIIRNIWYKGETLNEKYGIDESSYLFSYKEKTGFIGKENGKKFFFFNGQKISQDFDEIRPHTCCSIFPYPIEIDENGILFFMAKRGEKYFLVEANLNK